MSNAVDEPEGSRLQKAVETMVMTPVAAAKVVDGYRATFEDKNERKPESLEDKRRIAAKIIGRYSKMSAAAGAVTAAPSVVPGVGTAVAILGGGATDVAVALKLQVDMCMCLVEVFETELSTEDKKHLAFTIALAGSAEQMAAKGGKAAVQKIAQKLVYQYLTGPALVTIKQLFKRVSITFTQKAMAKAIPAGVGVAFSSSTNYVLTRVVGRVAVAVLAKDVK
ncbi:EcsC family protein [Streptomyces sp. NPDC007907]|uniref:EcsC family protein n=1 Tax=Streptomyces sp. NPDC007907 TaxID=3364789 RepID=UPI0036E2D071